MMKRLSFFLLQLIAASLFLASESLYTTSTNASDKGTIKEVTASSTDRDMRAIMANPGAEVDFFMESEAGMPTAEATVFSQHVDKDLAKKAEDFKISTIYGSSDTPLDLGNLMDSTSRVPAWIEYDPADGLVWVIWNNKESQRSCNGYATTRSRTYKSANFYVQTYGDFVSGAVGPAKSSSADYNLNLYLRNSSGQWILVQSANSSDSIDHVMGTYSCTNDYWKFEFTVVNAGYISYVTNYFNE